MGRLLLPAAVLAGAFVAERLGVREGLSPALLANLGRALFALTFLLAWRFRRGRVAWAAALLAASAEALRAGGPGEPVVTAALAFLLPVNLAALGWLRDWKVLSWTGAVRFGVLAAEAGGVALLGWSGLARPGLERLRSWLTAPGIEAGSVAGLDLPRAGLIAFASAALVLGVSVAWRRGPIEAALLGTLAASFAALSDSGAATAYDLAAGGLILGLSLVESAFSLAFEDGLTGLPARRALEETLRHLGRAYSIAMVDLDHFKKVNDRHGHEVGDQVLKLVAGKLGRVGGGGKAFRYGGEEFSVVFAGKAAAEAEPHLEALRRSVAERPFEVRSPSRPKKKPKKTRGTSGGASKSQALRVTVSIGLAEKNDKHRQPEDVMKAADKALYRSKKAGRNRVTVGR